MAIVVDAGPLVALADRSDARHTAVRRFMERSTEALFLSPFVLAEADHLIAKLLGVGAELRLLDDVARGALTLEALDEDDVRRCAEVVDRYRDLDVEVADASIVVLAARHGTRRVLTFDQRHFRAMRALDGAAFTVLPDDESRRPKR